MVRSTVAAAVVSTPSQTDDVLHPAVPGDRAHVALKALWDLDSCVNYAMRTLHEADLAGDEGCAMRALLLRMRTLASAAMEALDEKDCPIEEIEKEITGIL